MRKYVASIVGRQEMDSQNDEIRLFVPCTYENDSDVIYISYDEYEQNNPQLKITSTLKIYRDGLVVLTRSGVKNSKLTLEKSRRHMCRYETEFGNFMIGVFTHNISHDFSAFGGVIDLSYSLDSGSELLSKNTVNIIVKEV